MAQQFVRKVRNFPQLRNQLITNNRLASLDITKRSCCSLSKVLREDFQHNSQIDWKERNCETNPTLENTNLPDWRKFKSLKPSPSSNIYCYSIKGPGILGASGYKSLGYKYSYSCHNYVLNSHENYSTKLHSFPLQNVCLPPSYSSNTCTNRLSNFNKRYLHSSHASSESNTPSSQVEITVNALKEKAEEAKSKEKVIPSDAPSAEPITDKTIKDEPFVSSQAPETVIKPEQSSPSLLEEPNVVVKKSLWVKVKEEVLHYYHGFRLLFIDTKICIKYCYRVLNGDTLTRREHRQLVRTTGDLFRLLPFSIFIIIPFMEFLLPVALKLFPGMLPSTFETANEKEAKMKKRLKMKLEMAKFLQETLDSMPLESKGHKSQSAKEFVLFFEKVRRTGEQVSNEEILKFSKLFADSITLDSLSRPQLTAICTLLEMTPFGTNNFLRFQIRMKLRSLVADDKVIALEGTDSLSSWELQQACRSRGMRAYGMTDAKLRQQLNQWLELSLDKKVPQSLLLLSRTLYLPEAVDQKDTLAATISQLPDEIKTRTKAAIGKREGKIDNRTRLEVIQSEEKKILEDEKEEMEEEQQQQKKKEEEVAKRKVEEEKKAYKEELGIGEAEVVTIGPLGMDNDSIPITVQSVLSEAVKVTKATVNTRGEIKEDKYLLVDEAPILEDKAKSLDEDIKEEQEKTEEIQLSSQDLAEVEEALETIGAKQKRLLIEEQELSELKTEMQDYQEDIEDFKKVIAEVPERTDLKESKAARRLFSKINKMISQTDPVLNALNKKAEEMQKVVDSGDSDKLDRTTLVNLEDLISHLKQVTDAPDSTKLSVIRDVLTNMDTDNDGAIKVDHILKALELLSEDKVGIPRKLFEEVMLSIAKQEQLATKTVVQRAITTSKREGETGSEETNSTPHKNA